MYLVIRKGARCAAFSQLHQAAGNCWFSRGPAARYTLDQTVQCLAPAWNKCGSRQKQSAVGSRKGTVTTAAHHPPPTSQTTNLHQCGSEGASNMKASAVHCPAGDPLVLASPRILSVVEVKIPGSIPQTEDIRRDGDLDRGNGRTESTSSALSGSVVNCSNWVFMSASERSRST
jgi:hypothetical protein